MPRDDKKLSWLFGKGWSLVNILIGFIFAVGGAVAYIVETVLGFSIWAQSGMIPLWYSILAKVILSIMVVGPLFFWLVIPAFQKWWHTKQWLAWLLLVIAVVLFFAIISLLGFHI
jgi:hypothetical protein